MSDGFDPEFVKNLPRWFGRVVSSESWQGNILANNFDTEEEIKGWGYRYKVRVFSWHTGDKNVVPDEQLSVANVILPVTAGSGHGCYAETPSIASGTVVTGWFMDGEGGQEPYIDGILGNSNNKTPKSQKTGEIDGYQNFNDTFNKPGDKVPDFGIGINRKTIFRYDMFHANSKAWDKQQKDKEIETPLSSTRKCKNRNSEMKGIQTTIKNMVNDIENAKKELTKVRGYLGDIQSFASSIIPYVEDAASQASKYVKTLIANSRGWVLREIRKKINEVAPFLFPTQISVLENKLKDALGGLSCAFAKIINGLQQTFQGLLEDITNKFINIPMCAVEDIVTKLLSDVLEQIVSGITGALGPVVAFIQGAVGKGLNFLGSALDLLDIISGIGKFFICDEEQDCPEYDKINQAGLATPGKGLQLGLPKLTLGEPLPDAGGPGPSCPTEPQKCGPPEVLIFGKEGFGAIANAIISPNSNAIIGFDIVNPGENYFDPPYVSITDGCGRGRGAAAKAKVNPDGTIGKIAVTAPGIGYKPTSGGALGGNGGSSPWKLPTEGNVVDPNGNNFVVPEGVNPPNTDDFGDYTYYPPTQPENTVEPGTQPVTQDQGQYPVILEIDEVEVSDSGFGYQPGDTIQVTPDNGAVLEPIIVGDQVVGVNVVKPGIGFDDFPIIEVISDTGYNAEFIPIFKPVDPETINEIPPAATIIQVIDCVGKV